MSKKPSAAFEDAFVDLSKHKPTSGIIEKIQVSLKKGKLDVIEVVMNKKSALDVLTLNHGNRNPRYADVSRLANEMQIGNWESRVDPFVITSDGNLINGQKRSWATVLVDRDVPGFSWKQLIIVGAPPKTAPLMDTGAMRSLGDALRDIGMMGKDINNIAAAVRSIYYIENFNRLGSGLLPDQRMTNSDIVFWAKDKKKNDMESVQKLMTEMHELKKTMKFLSLSGFVALWYILRKINEEKADAFMRALATGKFNPNRIADENCLHLRNLLLNIQMKKTIMKSRGRDERYRCIIYAWNKSQEGIRIGATSKIRPNFENPAMEMPI